MSGAAIRPAPLSRMAALTVSRLALRELRGGLRGFSVFLACIALGVMAIAGVGSFADSLVAGLAREGRVILGGDLAFSLVHREATPEERAFLGSRGLLSAAATLRAMARTEDGRAALVEIKAVDAQYPLYGALALDPKQPLAAALAFAGGVFGAAADPGLLARLEVRVGERLRVGGATVEIRAALKNEPDKLAGGIAFAPRLLVSEAALRASGLLQPGSLVRWHYRLRLADPDPRDRMTAATVAMAQQRFPLAGWEIRTRANASPELGRNIERFTEFLTLVGLTALLVGGVGVANAVKSHLDRKRDVIATMRALGATGGNVFAIYLTQVLLLALIGAVLGMAAGAALPFLIAAGLASFVPIPIEPALHPLELFLGLTYGLLTALAFALWPLGRARDISAAALFRDAVAPERRLPRRRYMAATAAVVATLAALAVALAYDRGIAAMFIAAAAAAFLGLRLVAGLVMGLARRTARPRATLLRLVLANIHRPGALTPTVVLSLGLGLTLVVTLWLIDGNLHRELTAALPARAPSFYFVDLQQADAERFDAFVRARAPGANLERVPMLRGRIISLNGIRAEDLHPAPSAAWVLQSDRGITYAPHVPPGSRVVAGTWWDPGYHGPPLVSFDDKLAQGLGLRLGDPIVVNVLGRNIGARIANFRTVDWRTLGINFVLVFSPDTFRGAPGTQVATLTYPDGGATDQELALMKAVAEEFPAVTTVRVKDALEAVSKVVFGLTLAIRGASAVTLLAAVLVLAGALATGHRHRVFDAVVLKTLGATRRRLLLGYVLEYLLLGLATAVFGVAAGSLAAWAVVSRVMSLSFVWLAGPAVATASGALLLTVAFGLIGTFSALGRRPASVLRHL